MTDSKPHASPRAGLTRPGAGPMPRTSHARRTWLLLAAVAVFLTVGLPRWLAGDVAPPPTHTRATFTKLCRQHGGTPASGAQPVCTVRYGHQVYRMDAITPTGFDQDTANYQRQGCQLARSEQPSRGHRQTFVYHPTTGVCEHRP
jgi:hypothetical protein